MKAIKYLILLLFLLLYILNDALFVGARQVSFFLLATGFIILLVEGLKNAKSKN